MTTSTSGSTAPWALYCPQPTRHAQGPTPASLSTFRDVAVARVARLSPHVIDRHRRSRRRCSLRCASRGLTPLSPPRSHPAPPPPSPLSGTLG
uniref:Uncharacterized protein n=1 Tax=Oryza meridionalis TaxID=40149 RepID=A0A0E0EMJ6_9ORYZ